VILTASPTWPIASSRSFSSLVPSYLIPDGDPRRGCYLKNLGDMLGLRYDGTRDEKDLEEAIGHVGRGSENHTYQ